MYLFLCFFTFCSFFFFLFVLILVIALALNVFVEEMGLSEVFSKWPV